MGEAYSDGLTDPPRRFVDSELLLRRPECREKGGRFFFVRCVGGFRVSGRGFSRGGAAGSGVCGLTVLHCAAKLVRQDSGATGRPATSCIRRRRRLSGSRRAAMAVAGGPEPAFDAVRWSRNVRSRGSGSLPDAAGFSDRDSSQRTNSFAVRFFFSIYFHNLAVVIIFVSGNVSPSQPCDQWTENRMN